MTLLPSWAGAIFACLPNVILGVLLLVFRRPVSAFLTRTFGRLTYANPTLPMTLVILAGVFLIVVAGGLLASAVVTAVTS